MTIREILRETDYLTLLSPDQIAAEVQSGLLVLIDVQLVRSVRTIGLITRADWRPTPVQRHLLDLMHEVAAQR